MTTEEGEDLTDEYESMLCETIGVRGHEGAVVPAYFARPLGPGPFPRIVIIHYLPGWDGPIKEVVRRFATRGFVVVCPNLHYREAPDATPEEASQAVRDKGGISDAQCLGDVRGAAEHLAMLPYTTDKLGVIGFCSGGRQALMVAAQMPVDAVVDCYGGRVLEYDQRPDDKRPSSIVAMLQDIEAPILGLFGADDSHPTPDEVATIAAELDRAGKQYSFQIYEGAGHGFFSVDRAGYRVEAALDGYRRIDEWFARHLGATGSRGIEALTQ